MASFKGAEALAVIENLMATSRNDRVRMDATLAIIERAQGKPTQPTTFAGGAGGPVQVEAIGTDWVALRAAMKERGALAVTRWLGGDEFPGALARAR